jgi:hypothetical protein
MHFSATTTLSILALASAAFAGPLGIARRDNGTSGDDSNSDINIFPSKDHYNDFAICKGKVTKNQFPQLQAPSNDGGCVRYFQPLNLGPSNC